MCEFVPSSGSGLTHMYTPASKHKAMKKLDDMPTLQGRRSQAKQTMPIRASTKPRTVRYTQSVWQRLKRWVGGRPWNGPTWTRWGLVEYITLPGLRGATILIMPGVGSVARSEVESFGDRSTRPRSSNDAEDGAAAVAWLFPRKIPLFSICCSSLLAIFSLYRIKKNAARNDMKAEKYCNFTLEEKVLWIAVNASAHRH